MNEQKLEQYIKMMKDRGSSDLEIKNNLKQAGWPDLTIEKHFETQVEVPRPNLEEWPIKQLNPRSIILFAITNTYTLVALVLAIFYFLPALFFLVVEGESFSYIALTAFFLLFFLLIMYVIAKLTYKYYRYTLKEQGFYKEYGILAKKYVTIPYDKIQNIDVYQTIIARILGLYSLNIQTAGMSGKAGAEGVLPGLDKEEANRVKDELLRRSRMLGRGSF